MLLAVLAAVPAHAATLRTMTTLHGPNVYLRDLFEDAGANADRLLGPGPAPGGRIIVEAAQLNAIARQFDVTWRSLSRGDRAVLEWPGRPLRKEEATDAVRNAFTSENPADTDIDLAGFVPPIVPADATPAASVSQLEYDSGSGRFSAVLTVAADGMAPIDTPIAGRIEEMVEAPVAATRLLPDMVLRSDDVRIARVPASLLQSEVARLAEQVVGMQLRRPVMAGQPLRLADLTRPALVQRGSVVQIELSSPGLTITGQAIALDSGADHETIRIQNTTSRAFLFARVVGPGQVRVEPGAPPALPTAPARLDRTASVQ